MEPLSLLIATHNPKKTLEFAAVLGANFVVSDLTTYCPDTPPVAETEETFEGNAALKAVSASRTYTGLVVADDSGLEVDSLGGAPGVYSARFAGPDATDAANIAKLLAALGSHRSPGERRARFRCVLALARGGKILRIAVGTVEGIIAEEPRGQRGFGYDPVFLPESSTRTFAEMGPEAKNRQSHRSRAITELRNQLTSR